jgi:membrane protease YdiL (CAAX protease family)
MIKSTKQETGERYLPEDSNSSLAKNSIFSPRHSFSKQKSNLLPLNTEVFHLAPVTPADNNSMALKSIRAMKSSLLTSYSAIALGAYFLPNFTNGLIVGTFTFLTTTALSSIIDLIQPLPAKDSPYLRYLRENSLQMALFNPILEELVFRGLFQPTLIEIITLLFPEANNLMLFGTGLTLATGISILMASVHFGAFHLPNQHEKAHIQAFNATLAGIALGYLSQQFGLIAAAAAHIMHNTLAVTVDKLMNTAAIDHTPSLYRLTCCPS